MPYSAKEIQSIKELIETLVAQKRIGIELDAYGNPSAIYDKQVTDILVDAITDLPGFPISCVVDNAMRDATSNLSGEIFAAFKNKMTPAVVQQAVFNIINLAIYEEAFLEIPESLFTQKELRAMLRQHPDFLDMVQRDIDAHKLFADEMDDSKERVADMRAA